jgi:hypothetical protein
MGHFLRREHSDMNLVTRNAADNLVQEAEATLRCHLPWRHDPQVSSLATAPWPQERHAPCLSLCEMTSRMEEFMFLLCLNPHANCKTQSVTRGDTASTQVVASSSRKSKSRNYEQKPERWANAMRQFFFQCMASIKSYKRFKLNFTLCSPWVWLFPGPS